MKNASQDDILRQSFFPPFTGPLGTRLGFSQKFGDPSEEVDEKLKIIEQYFTEFLDEID